MGHCPDWTRKSFAKGLADGGTTESLPDIGEPSRRERSVEADGSVGSFQQTGVNGVGGGGRISYSKSLDDDSSVSASIAGGGSRVKVNSPGGEMTKRGGKVGNIDLTYRKGDHSITASYQRNANIPEHMEAFGPENIGGQNKTFMLKYRREF